MIPIHQPLTNSEEDQLQRARILWEFIVKNYTKYTNNDYGFHYSIRGLILPVKMCLLGWSRQAFPDAFLNAITHALPDLNGYDALEFLSHSHRELTKLSYNDRSNVVKRISTYLLPKGLVLHSFFHDHGPQLLLSLHGMFPEVSLTDSKMIHDFAHYLHNAPELNDLLTDEQRTFYKDYISVHIQKQDA